MTNIEIAKLLREIAAVYSIKDEKKFYFQMIAYQKAADAIEHSTIEASDLWQQGKLRTIPGVGATLSQHLEELFKSGKVKHFEEMRKQIPESVFPLLGVPKIGPKTAYKLVTVLKLTKPAQVLKDLEHKAKTGEIAQVPGFGEKSQNEILVALAEFYRGKTKTSRLVFPYAFEIAQRAADYLKKCPQVKEVEMLGSLRRKVVTVGDIDIAVASEQPQEVLTWFTKFPELERVIEVGQTTSSILIHGERQIDLMIQPPKGFGALLQHFTGSKAHNIHLRMYAQSKGLSLSEYGIKSANKIQNSKFKIQNYDKQSKIYRFTTEKDFYDAIGLEWIPPEMREDSGEIELAIKHQLPKLVELEDIKGDLHVHSSFNIEPSHDLGANSLLEMAKKAQKMNYNYIGFAEHNPSITAHTDKQIYDLIYQRNKEIEHIKSSFKNFYLFKLLEVDILANGRLAIDDKSLSLLDGAIVSIHSSFSQNKENMTKRILKGLSHPKARILGHPTGRLLNRRESVEADWEEIMRYCFKNNKALEINAWPTRLDLPDELVRQAVKIGVKLVINTDSHAAGQLEVMKYGVDVAKRGWATKKDILNTLPLDEFKNWLANL